MGARRGLGRALVGGPPGRVVAQEAVANPHDLAAPAACTGGHRVRSQRHGAPGDLPARLADVFRNARHVKPPTRSSFGYAVCAGNAVGTRLR